MGVFELIKTSVDHISWRIAVGINGTLHNDVPFGQDRSYTEHFAITLRMKPTS